MRTLNLHQLATFQVVAKHCSYVRAAEELHFSQPAVSAQIRQLEETLGTLRSLDVNYLFPGHGRPILAKRPLENASVEW